MTIGAIKKFRKTPWRFQETFQTPLKDLGRFVSVIPSSEESMEHASIVIDQIVFEPKNLKALIQNNNAEQLSKDWSLTATCKLEVQSLLHAAFSDWVDFAFIPSPKPFVIYADHDEYATFYANTKSNLNSVISILTEAKFKRVINWQRHF